MQNLGNTDSRRQLFSLRSCAGRSVGARYDCFSINVHGKLRYKPAPVVHNANSSSIDLIRYLKESNRHPLVSSHCIGKSLRLLCKRISCHSPPDQMELLQFSSSSLLLLLVSCAATTATRVWKQLFARLWKSALICNSGQ